MTVISTSKFTERLTRKLQRAGRKEWVAQSSGDGWGKYLIFQVGGRCIAGCGWTQAEAKAIVEDRCSVMTEYSDPARMAP